MKYRHFFERRDLTDVLIKTVLSTVHTDNTGTIEVNYKADKKLEAEWAEIKNANSDKIKVRTSGLSGSPGCIITYAFYCYINLHKMALLFFKHRFCKIFCN